MNDNRKFLKPDWQEYKKNFDKVDANQGIPPLPLEKPFSRESKFIDLILMGETSCGNQPLPEVILKRCSAREYSGTSLTLEEISYLLWATQGLKYYDAEWGVVKTVVPSAGMVHSLETYLYINRVEGIAEGIYRYLPYEQKLLEVNTDADIGERLKESMYGNLFDAAVVFIWTAFPYKMEYGYSTVAHKMVAIEAGHVCQNLYLAAESINCGCCAIAAYIQESIDEVVGADGEDEFVIYTATIGKYK